MLIRLCLFFAFALWLGLVVCSLALGLASLYRRLALGGWLRFVGSGYGVVGGLRLWLARRGTILAELALAYGLDGLLAVMP